jgi:flagellar motor switch protein FliN/FliY
VDGQLHTALVDSFVNGVGEALDALLSFNLKHQVHSLEELEVSRLTGLLDEHPIYGAVMAGDDGAVALLLEKPVAARLLARYEGRDETAATEITDADRTSLTEFLSAAVSRGIERLRDDFAQDFTPEEPTISDRGTQDSPALSAMLGPSCTAAWVSFTSDPDIAFDAVVLYSSVLSTWDTEAEAAASTAASTSPLLSAEEMSDILRGFDPQEDGGGVSQFQDIRLRATARLGSVEIPLGDVLSFGPGSIIDVGRLVDEPVDLLVNNKLIARGDIVVVDEKYGLRITEIISPRERIESLR